MSGSRKHERSFVAENRHSYIENAPVDVRYRSKSPLHYERTGGAFEDLGGMRQKQYMSRFGAELAGGIVHHRTSASNVAHLSPEGHLTTHTTVQPIHHMREVRHTEMQPVMHNVMRPVTHQVMQPVRHTVMGEVRHRIPEPLTVVRENVMVHSSQHQEFFISELSAEINEIKARSRDFDALKDQYRYLQDQYQEALKDKSTLESQCLTRISQDRAEVDKLIRELDIVKSENIQAEEEQIKLLEMVAVCESEYISKSSELNGLRQQSSIDDQANLNLRKEIQYQDTLLVEQKEISHSHYKDLTNLREIQFNLDKEIDVTSKRYQILRTEIENNEQRIHSISTLLAQKEDQFGQCLGKINEATQVIQENKYALNKLDGELGYMESNNEQHKCAQGQLFKANEYEYTQSKDLSLKMSEMSINYTKMENEEQSLGHEINRLKAHSDQMMKDQVDLQAEVDALDKHMANLNNQNYALQKELEAFIESDEAVRCGLDRKSKVDHIRNKVDDVIRRSEQEVEERILDQKHRRISDDHRQIAVEQHMMRQPVYEQRIIREERVPVVERIERTVEHIPAGSRYEVDRQFARSANHYSPVRHEYVQRAAYRQEDASRRVGSQGPGAEHIYTRPARNGASPLRRSPGRPGKQVQFDEQTKQ